MVSAAALLVRQAFLQLWCRIRLKGLKSSEGHEEFLQLPHWMPPTYHPYIHFLGKIWKTDKPVRLHRAGKTLLLNFLSSGSMSQVKKWVPFYLMLWFTHYKTLLWVQSDISRNGSKSTPDTCVMLYEILHARKINEILELDNKSFVYTITPTQGGV